MSVQTRVKERAEEQATAMSAEQQAAIRMVANDLHRLNHAVMKAVDAGVSVELIRSARHHNEGNWGEFPVENHTLDIGVGRIPASSVEEAANVVDKIINYDTNKKTLGQWRKNIVFVADDGDLNQHQQQADRGRVEQFQQQVVSHVGRPQPMSAGEPAVQHYDWTGRHATAVRQIGR